MPWLPDDTSPDTEHRCHLPGLWLRRVGRRWRCPTCDTVWRIALAAAGGDAYRYWRDEQPDDHDGVLSGFRETGSLIACTQGCGESLSSPHAVDRLSWSRRHRCGTDTPATWESGGSVAPHDCDRSGCTDVPGDEDGAGVRMHAGESIAARPYGESRTTGYDPGGVLPTGTSIAPHPHQSILPPVPDETAPWSNEAARDRPSPWRPEPDDPRALTAPFVEFNPGDMPVFNSIGPVTVHLADGGYIPPAPAGYRTLAESLYRVGAICGMTVTDYHPDAHSLVETAGPCIRPWGHAGHHQHSVSTTDDGEPGATG